MEVGLQDHPIAAGRHGCGLRTRAQLTRGLPGLPQARRPRPGPIGAPGASPTAPRGAVAAAGAAPAGGWRRMELPALTHLPPRQWRPERKRWRGGAGSAAAGPNGQRGSRSRRRGRSGAGPGRLPRAHSKDGGSLKGPRTAVLGTGTGGRSQAASAARCPLPCLEAPRMDTGQGLRWSQTPEESPCNPRAGSLIPALLG